VSTQISEFPLGATVRVDLAGRVVGRSELEDGGKSYLIEYERRGTVQRQWVVADKLVLAE
jgi:hypothetical protein